MAFYKKRIFKIISAIVALFIVFFIMLVYFGYLDWKKTLITKISSRSTVFIGQEVNIEDLTFSLFRGLTLQDISIKNPKGFDSGDLLHIKKLYIHFKLRDLIMGRYFLENVTVYLPEVSIIKDKSGNINISEKLAQILNRESERKSKLTYHINELRIESGIFDFNNIERCRAEKIDLTIQNISSSPRIKTVIKGRMSYAGDSKIEIEGWAYLTKEPKTFTVSIESEDFNPGAFKDVLDRYKIKTDKARIRFNMLAEGNTEKGLQFNSRFRIKDARTDFLKKAIKDILIEADGFFNIHEDSLRINSFSFKADDVSDVLLKGVITDLRKEPAYAVNLQIYKLDLSALKPFEELRPGGIIKAKDIHVKGEFKKKIQRLSGKIHCVNCALKSDDADADIEIKKETPGTPSNTEKAVNAENIPYNITAGDIECAFKGTTSTSGYHGNGIVDAKDISVSEIKRKRNILKNTVLHSELTFKGEDVDFKADTLTGKIAASISGTSRRFLKQDRFLKIKAHLPKIDANDIRESFWDIFPDSLLYAGLDGYVSSDFSVDYHNSELEVTGDLKVQDFILQGENGKYFVGPLNGTIPVLYSNKADKETKTQLTSFDRSNFEDLNTYFSREITEPNYRKVTIGSLSYGFKLLEDVEIWIGKDTNTLNIKRFKGNIFGGRLNGSALVDFSDGLQYSVGILVKGLSLNRLCEDIEPIRGFLSGAVDGVLFMKGSGTTVSHLIGKADFWTYSTKQEKTKISKEFLRKVGGTSIKTYLGNRAYDKGIMGLYIKDGFIIFRELEISNRNLIGITDLSVKVVPLNNKISIENLMWTIVEAAQRAKKK